MNPDPTDPSHGVHAPIGRLGRLPRTTSRRGALLLFGGAGLGAVALACSPSEGSTGSGGSATSTTGGGGTSTTSAADGSTACAVIPQETAGPYPGDGSNGVDVLTQDGIVRSDIRSSFGSASGTATGVPLTIELTVVDTGSSCTPMEGAAVYLWHCDIDGKYSRYSQGVTDQNYLRGVQAADANGVVRFTSIFPAAYSGRWPHIHFEVYSNVDDATGGGDPIATSQLALPEDVCDAVYATSGYSQSVRNMSQTSLATDNVFSDGADQETPTVTGNVTDGYVAALTVPV